MAFVSPRMSLKVWNSPSDPYDHEQLADNFLKLDIHDHSAGRGAQIGAAGIQNGAITNLHIQNGSITNLHLASSFKLLSPTLAPTMGRAQCTAGNVFGTATDITGASLSITPTVASILFVSAQFEILANTPTGIWTISWDGILNIDGAAHARLCHWETSVSASDLARRFQVTGSMTWTIPLTAAAHTIKLQVVRAANSVGSIAYNFIAGGSGFDYILFAS